MLDAIADPVSAFSAHLDKRKAMNDRLSVVDKHEFEDWLVARVLVMRCESDYQSLLLPLKLRLDAIGVGDKRHHQSVFGPALLVSAFQPAIQSLIIDSATEKLIFKVFEQKVMLLLKGLYEGLNAILIRHHVLPTLNMNQLNASGLKRKAKKSKPVVTPAAADHSQTHKPESPASSTNNSVSPHVGSNASLQTGYLNTSNQEHSQTFTLPPFASSADETHKFTENQHRANNAISNLGNLLRSLRGRHTDTANSESDNSNAAHLNSDAQKEAYSASELDEGLSILQANSATIDWNEAPTRLLDRVQGQFARY